MVVLSIIAIAISILLITRRRFWVVLFGVGAPSSSFTMLASIIHFQIFIDVMYFFLMCICSLICSALVEPK